MNFDQSFDALEVVEKGYTNDPQDPGGETKYGVSKRSYPGEDIKNLTLDRAKELFLRDFWGPAGCDAVPDSVKFDLFDTAINSGPHRAVVLLQKAVGSYPDGQLGPNTLMMVQSTPPDKLRRRFNGFRLIFMQSLQNWNHNAGGWALRVANNLLREP